ncbi:MAG: ComF family protein [Oscillospiraceae bacterium]
MRNKLLRSDFWLDILFPNRCPFCGGIIPWDRLCCAGCYAEIPFMQAGAGCGQERALHYDRCLTAAFYEGNLRAGILALKNDNGVNLAKLLAAELFGRNNSAQFARIDAVCFVPMSRESRALRNYNQAQVIARIAAKQLRKPVLDALVKTDGRSPQHTLGYAERIENVRGAFALRGRLALTGKHLLICDDIVTTGSTLSECARVLKQAGAAHVTAFTLAATRLSSLPPSTITEKEQTL